MSGRAIVEPCESVFNEWDLGNLCGLKLLSSCATNTGTVFIELGTFWLADI